MMSTFDNATPHGGPPFQGWKKGFGFGRAAGPGMYVGSRSIPAKLSETPGGDRCYASNDFWKRKDEIGAAYRFGTSERPDAQSQIRKQGYSVSPDQYGDICRCLPKTKKQVLRKNITCKPRFPSMEEKYRDLSWPKSGPGPGKYDTRIPPGQSGWKNPVASPAWTMGSKQINDRELLEKVLMAGPAEYTTRIPCGRNNPIRHCSQKALYDIQLKSRTPIVEPGASSPGPARYNIKGKFDQYTLGAQIHNCKCPPWEELRRMPSPLASPLGSRSASSIAIPGRKSQPTSPTAQSRDLAASASSPAI
jgi:hypothetical protein